MQIAEIVRNTKETQISLKLNINGSGKYSISTGFNFFNHMLEQFSYHGNFDIELKAKSLDCDSHHLVEDIAIALGAAFSQSLGDKKGITRYSNVVLPMDDALILCAVDISGRPFCKTDFKLADEKTSDFETVLLPHFYNSFAQNASLTLHIKQLDGFDTHHIIECSFKCFAHALKIACTKDITKLDEIPSTKGIL